MAKKASSSDNKVTRIKASDATPAKAVRSTVKKTVKTEKKPRRERKPIGGFFGYFIGAWKELREVRWPNRRATWGLTLAVLAFSGFFVAFILILDAFFKYIFELILK